MLTPYHGMSCAWYRTIAVFVVLLLAATSARPGMAADDTHSMQAIILAQMEAFKRDDGAAAFAFASPGIRSMFGSAERFMHMVRSGYPQVYRPQSIEFRDVVEFRSLRHRWSMSSVKTARPYSRSIPWSGSLMEAGESTAAIF